MADDELDRLLDGFLDFEEEMKATKRNQNETNDDAVRSNPETKYDTERNRSLSCDRNFYMSKFPQETRVAFNHPPQFSGQSYWHGRGISTSDSVAGAQYSSFEASEESRPNFFLLPVGESRSDFSRTDDNQQNLSSPHMEPKNTSFSADTRSRTSKENLPSERLPARKRNCFHSMPPPQMSSEREESAVIAQTAGNYRKISTTSTIFSQTEYISNIGITADRVTIDSLSALLPSVIQTLPNLSVKVKEFRCEICGRCFNFKRNLKAHGIIHTIEKSCKACGQRITGSDAWRKHILTHYKILHECSVCKRKFGQKSVLNVHFRIHTKDKTFTCDICHKEFGRKDTLKRHYRTHSVKRP